MHYKTMFKEKNEHRTDSAVGRFVCAQDLMQHAPVFLRIHSTIQQAMQAFRDKRMSSLLAAHENPLDGSLSLSGRVCLKDVFCRIYLSLMQKDLISLNQVLHQPIENILIGSQKTVNTRSDIKEILSVMLADFPYVTGVVQNGTLVGQICFTDLLNQFKPVNGKDSPWIEFIQEALPESSRVSNAMATHVLCLSPQDEVSKVMGVFMALETPCIPILDEQGKLKRIIYRMEILEYILQLIEAKELTVFEQKGLILDRTVGSLEEKEVAAISGNDSLVDAVQKMIEKNNFCLAVTDVHRRFCGLLTFTDILNWVYAHLK